MLVHWVSAKGKKVRNSTFACGILFDGPMCTTSIELVTCRECLSHFKPPPKLLNKSERGHKLRYEKAEKALLLNGFKLCLNDEWEPPVNPSAAKYNALLEALLRLVEEQRLILLKLDRS